MLKMVAAGATVFFLAISPLAQAQTSSAGKSDQITAADWNNLTDLRIDLIKAALQLTARSRFCATAIPLGLCSAAPTPWLNARLI